MSRSYRKPYWTDGYGGSWRKLAKRLAARKVRKAKFVANGGYYKKLYCSWNICDFSFPDFLNADKPWKAGSK